MLRKPCRPGQRRRGNRINEARPHFLPPPLRGRVGERGGPPRRTRPPAPPPRTTGASPPATTVPRCKGCLPQHLANCTDAGRPPRRSVAPPHTLAIRVSTTAAGNPDTSRVQGVVARVRYRGAKPPLRWRSRGQVRTLRPTAPIATRPYRPRHPSVGNRPGHPESSGCKGSLRALASADANRRSWRHARAAHFGPRADRHRPPRTLAPERRPPARQPESSGCKGSLRAFAPRTQTAAPAAAPRPQILARARIATAHHHPRHPSVDNRRGSRILGVQGIVARVRTADESRRSCRPARSARFGPRANRHRPPHRPRHPSVGDRPGSPDPRGVWDRCAILPRPLREWAARSGPRVRRGGPTQQACPSARPSLPAAPCPTRRPPCHVARGVTAVPAIAPTRPSVRPPHAPPAPNPPTTTVPRSMGCHRSPAIAPSLPIGPSTPRTTGAKPAHHHRATLQGVSPHSPQLHRTRPSARPPPHHRRQTCPPPPCHVARGVTAVPAIAPNPPIGTLTTNTTGAKPGHRHRATLQGVSSQSPQLHQTRPSARPPASQTPTPAHRDRPTVHGLAAQYHRHTAPAPRTTANAQGQCGKSQTCGEDGGGTQLHRGS